MNTGSPRHDELEALIAADALGGLEEESRREMLRLMAEHGPDCAECIRLTVQYAEVAGNLALVVDPAALSPEAEESLIRAARQIRTRPGRTRRWVTAAVAAAVLAVVSGTVGYSLAPDLRGRPSEFLAFASQPGSEVVAFPASGGQQLAVIFNRDSRRGWVFGTNLRQPEGEQVYELWFSSSTSEGVEPAGTFLPEDGLVLAPVTVGVDPDLLAVSVEPPGGSPRPTSDPIFVAET
jgi:anti-sigma-K factor RskA